MEKVDNIKVFDAGLRDFAEKTVKPKLAAMLKRVATRVVAYIGSCFQPLEPYGGGSEKFPIWTGNLRDATGVGVYIDGALTGYHPIENAVTEQEYNGVGGIIGTEELSQAFNLALTTYSTGIWIVLFSAVPYAYEVNIAGSPIGRGIGFFNELEEYLYNDVINNIKVAS